MPAARAATSNALVGEAVMSAVRTVGEAALSAVIMLKPRV